jgi:hypothetical protein
MTARRRGRPLKFGRPAQLLTVTLPQDVVGWLQGIHPDPAWAIVSLYNRLVHPGSRAARRARPRVELAGLTGRRALIVVDPAIYRSLPGVAVIPVAAERAFLALETGRGVADLELAILDRVEDRRTAPAERRNLEALLREVRGWRRSRGYRFSSRSIIIVERHEPRARRRP